MKRLIPFAVVQNGKISMHHVDAEIFLQNIGFLMDRNKDLKICLIYYFWQIFFANDLQSAKKFIYYATYGSTKISFSGIRECCFEVEKDDDKMVFSFVMP
jgi:hypothetical protein